MNERNFRQMLAVSWQALSFFVLATSALAVEPNTSQVDRGKGNLRYCEACLDVDESISPTATYQTVSGSTVGQPNNEYSYSFCAVAGGVYRFTFCEGGGSATYDTALSVQGPDACGTYWVCNDDYCGLQSQLDFTAPFDGTFIVVVDGFGSNTGSYTLAYRGPEYNCWGACCFDDVCVMLDIFVCLGQGGDFYGGSCDPNPCPQPPTGVCCLPGGECLVVTEGECMSQNGTAWQEGGVCPDAALDSPRDIPDFRVRVIEAPGGYLWSRSPNGPWNIGCPPDTFAITTDIPLYIHNNGDQAVIVKDEGDAAGDGNYERSIATAIQPHAIVKLAPSKIEVILGTVIGALQSAVDGIGYVLGKIGALFGGGGYAQQDVVVEASLGIFSSSDSVSVECSMDSSGTSARWTLIKKVGQANAYVESSADDDVVFQQVGDYAVYDSQGILLDYSGTVVTAVGEDSDRLEVRPLGLPMPNPVTGEVTCSIELARSAKARLDVLDVSGRLIDTLIDSDLPAGRHSFSWNPSGRTGRPIPNGVYYFRLNASGSRTSRMFVLIR